MSLQRAELVASALLVTVTAVGPSRAAEPARPVAEAEAILLRLGPTDLAAMARDALDPDGDLLLDGWRAKSSSGMRELSYRAAISEPRVQLDGAGGLRVNFELLRGDLRVGSVERKILFRRARCEHLGLEIDPQRPLDVSLDLQVGLEDGAVRLVPQALQLAGDGRGVHLSAPTRCAGAPLPRRVLWWLAKPRLRRRLARFDAELLERARVRAARWAREDVELSWPIVSRPRGAPGPPLFLHLQDLRTDTRGVLASFAAAGPQPPAAPAAIPAWATARSSGSFLALPESFLNEAAAAATRDVPERRVRPGGDFARAWRSDSIFALIPGLREIGPRDALEFRISLHSTPRIEVVEVEADPQAPGSNAALRVHLGGVRVELFDVDRAEPLGTLDIDSGELTVIPHRSVLGGLSFAVVQNDWTLSSRGIEFNDDLLAATLQETVFGALFETRQDPVGRDALRIGDTWFRPSRVTSEAGYLIIEIESAAPGSTRTDNLRASR